MLEHLMAKKRKISSAWPRLRTMKEICPHHLLSVFLLVPCCPSCPVLAAHGLHGSPFTVPWACAPAASLSLPKFIAHLSSLPVVCNLWLTCKTG